MGSFDAKRVADSVHGTIGLSELEAAVINTGAFQRLRNVKQLGLAPLVFPGADYSRFSHCLGACHVTGRILEALRSSGSAASLTDEQIQLYRLSALLHDIGHYPYSHAMEEAVRDYYLGLLLSNKEDGSGEAAASGDEAVDEELSSFMHERLGKEILLKDTELSRVLDDKGMDAEDISAIFMGERPDVFLNLVHSDLDVDRIDYLLRTAHHTGLPYGSVDLDYLISQMRLDRDNQLCITKKALRTADHFLLCRHFDYQQVTYHHTVVAAELVLKEVLKRLLEEGAIDCSSRAVSRMISDRTWYDFDDASILQRLWDLHRNPGDEISLARTAAVLERRPPKLVAEAEYISERDNFRQFLNEKQLINEHIPEWAGRFGIDKRLWYVWPAKIWTLTNVGSRVPISAVMEMSSEGKGLGEYEQGIRVLNESSGTSTPITGISRSLMSVLANYAVYPLRVYVLFPAGAEETEARRREIRKRIQEDLKNLHWI